MGMFKAGNEKYGNPFDLDLQRKIESGEVIADEPTGHNAFERAESKQRMKSTINGHVAPVAKRSDTTNRFQRHDAMKESQRTHEQEVAEREAEREAQRQEWQHRSPAAKTVSGTPLTPELAELKAAADATRTANKPKQVQPLDAETKELIYETFRRQAYPHKYRHSEFNKANIIAACEYNFDVLARGAWTVANMWAIARELDGAGFLENPESRGGTSAAKRWESPVSNGVRPVTQTINQIDGETWADLHNEDFDSLQKRVRAGFKSSGSR